MTKIRVTVELDFDDVELDEGETPYTWAEDTRMHEWWYLFECNDGDRIVKVEELDDQEAASASGDRLG